MLLFQNKLSKTNPMKTILKHITYSFILLCIGLNVYAQQVTITQKELPYSIPIIEKPSSGNNIQYQWLENGMIIIGANSPKYTIPSGKTAGNYIYINQIKCNECTDWLNSNPFTVNIYGTSKPKSAGIPTASLSASFSPQEELYGYLDKLISVIDNAQHSIDIDLYGFESYDVYMALKRAIARGVQIRLLYDGALEDHKKADSTVSHQIEAIGIDVRYVNKTNHHKFIISDKNFLVTSSGNWNNEANSVYDENTLWINDTELVLRYRAEFEYLWNNSREFGVSHIWPVVNPDSLLNQIVDNPNVDAVFTSSNYRTYISGTYGPTFASISGKQNVADRIVELINHSQHSIRIAANHLRSRPIAEALILKKSQNPQINIQVYLDGQEYISKGYNNYQKTKRNECLAGATTQGQIRDCMEKDFYYSYELILAGIDVRFKTYSYKWDAATSALMHHKYAIFDDSIVTTGSYNYSYNAETNSMENVVVFNRIASDNSVTDYINNFSEIWNTGRQSGYYNELQSHLSSDSRYIPVLFPSMSLTYSEVTSLKQQIESACPAVTSDFFSDNRQYFSTFLRDITLSYDNNNRITTAQDSRSQAFSVNYSYNGQNAITCIAFQSNDGSTFEESYQYDGNNNLTSLNSPLFNLNLTYNNNELSSLDAGRGAHSWLCENNANGALTRYSTPVKQDYISVSWNNNGLPSNVTDAENRSMQLSYNGNDVLSSITTSDRSIQFTVDNAQSQYNAVSSDGESITILQPSLDELNISTMGTVSADIKYVSTVQPDKKQALNIEITSNNVASGTGKKATIDYLLDSYGRVINSGSLAITRKPYSGNILTVSNGGILETRTYNDWELLTEQSVTFNGTLVYKANYQYNAI
jgi:YD repeat-containing protein